jgi:hypothetical protein
MEYTPLKNSKQNWVDCGELCSNFGLTLSQTIVERAWRLNFESFHEVVFNLVISVTKYFLISCLSSVWEVLTLKYHEVISLMFMYVYVTLRRIYTIFWKSQFEAWNYLQIKVWGGTSCTIDKYMGLVYIYISIYIYSCHIYKQNVTFFAVTVNTISYIIYISNKIYMYFDLHLKPSCSDRYLFYSMKRIFASPSDFVLIN